MESSRRFGRGVMGWSTILKVVLTAGLVCVTLPAMAIDDGRDIIGPHEYDLPTNFEPFDIFVQYFDFNNGGNTWDSAGNKAPGPHTQELIGISKYVHFWVPDWAPNIGLGYEVLLPEVGIRTAATPTVPGSSSGGLSDPLTGPVIWFKPIKTENLDITLGQDFFLQVPVGDSSVGGGDVWHINTAFLYNIDYYKWSLVGDVGVIAPLSTSTNTGTRPGMDTYLDALLSYKLFSHLEPFVGTTYETIGSTRNLSTAMVQPRGHETLVSGGFYIPMFAKQSIAVRYSRGISGENHSVTSEFGIRYIIAW